MEKDYIQELNGVIETLNAMGEYVDMNEVRGAIDSRDIARIDLLKSQLEIRLTKLNSSR